MDRPWFLNFLCKQQRSGYHIQTIADCPTDVDDYIFFLYNTVVVLELVLSLKLSLQGELELMNACEGSIE